MLKNFLTRTLQALTLIFILNAAYAGKSIGPYVFVFANNHYMGHNDRGAVFTSVDERKSLGTAFNNVQYNLENIPPAASSTDEITGTFNITTTIGSVKKCLTLVAFFDGYAPSFESCAITNGNQKFFLQKTGDKVTYAGAGSQEYYYLVRNLANPRMCLASNPYLTFNLGRQIEFEYCRQKGDWRPDRIHIYRETRFPFAGDFSTPEAGTLAQWADIYAMRDTTIGTANAAFQSVRPTETQTLRNAGAKSILGNTSQNSNYITNSTLSNLVQLNTVTATKTKTYSYGFGTSSTVESTLGTDASGWKLKFATTFSADWKWDDTTTDTQTNTLTTTIQPGETIWYALGRYSMTGTSKFTFLSDVNEEWTTPFITGTFMAPNPNNSFAVCSDKAPKPWLSICEETQPSANIQH